MDPAFGATAAGLRLHLNENTAGCSPAVLQALASMRPTDISSYPDIGPITRQTAEYLGLPRQQVLLTNGLDEGLQVTAAWASRSMVGSGRAPQIIILQPTFEMYAEFAAMIGARLSQIPHDVDFEFPLTALLSALSPDTRVIYLADPNNPTGRPVPSGAAALIAERAPQAMVFVDEAYADFSGRTLIGPLLTDRRNLIVGRTFAKAHGLAGLRIGAVAAHEETIGALQQLVPPFSVNVCAIRALSAALGDTAHLEWYVRQSEESRAIIYEFCHRHGFDYWPSEGNFVLIRLGARAPEIVAELETRGISVRDRSRVPGCQGCIRLTAGVVAHTNTALDALEACLAARPN
jgi:histidinol-phosphate aminotransferase